MKDFVKDNFPVLLVSAIFVVLCVMLLLETHLPSGNDAVLLWLEHKIGEALSAIFMGLGGPAAKKLMRRE